MGRYGECAARLEDLEIQGDIGRYREIWGDMGRYREIARLEYLEVEHGGLAQDLLAEQQRARLHLARLAALELLLRVRARACRC